jgi:hypothetical protein
MFADVRNSYKIYRHFPPPRSRCNMKGSFQAVCPPESDTDFPIVFLDGINGQRRVGAVHHRYVLAKNSIRRVASNTRGEFHVCQDDPEAKFTMARAEPSRPSFARTALRAPSGQIHADGFRFPGLRIDAHFKGDDLALGDLIALS